MSNVSDISRDDASCRTEERVSLRLVSVILYLCHEKRGLLRAEIACEVLSSLQSGGVGSHRIL